MRLKSASVRQNPIGTDPGNYPATIGTPELISFERKNLRFEHCLGPAATTRVTQFTFLEFLQINTIVALQKPPARADKRTDQQGIAATGYRQSQQYFDLDGEISGEPRTPCRTRLSFVVVLGESLCIRIRKYVDPLDSSFY